MTFKGNKLTVSNPARVRPTFKIAITKIWYVQTFWNLYFNWSVYHLNSVLLLSVGLNLFLWAADLSTITVAPHEQWNDLLAVFKDSIFTKKRMFYKLYSAWVQNSSVITKLYVFRNPVGVQICTFSISRFQFSLKMEIYVYCVFGSQEQSYKIKIVWSF